MLHVTHLIKPSAPPCKLSRESKETVLHAPTVSSVASLSRTLGNCLCRCCCCNVIVACFPYSAAVSHLSTSPLLSLLPLSLPPTQFHRTPILPSPGSQFNQFILLTTCPDNCLFSRVSNFRRSNQKLLRAIPHLVPVFRRKCLAQ